MTPAQTSMSDLTDAELVRRAQGCTEFTCPHHGAYNMESSRRRNGDAAAWPRARFSW